MPRTPRSIRGQVSNDVEQTILGLYADAAAAEQSISRLRETITVQAAMIQALRQELGMQTTRINNLLQRVLALE